MKKKASQTISVLRKRTLITASTLALAIVFGGMAPWAHAAPETIATVEVYPSEIVFIPVGEAENHMLTVGGDNGFYFEEEFVAGENPWFPLDGEGSRLSDGSYKYELRTQPEVDREALEEAELAGDDRVVEAISRAEQKLVKVQTGSFEVVTEEIVLPEELENNAGAYEKESTVPPEEDGLGADLQWSEHGDDHAHSHDDNYLYDHDPGHDHVHNE